MPEGLILLPNALDQNLASKTFVTSEVLEAISEIKALIAESKKGAYLFLKQFSLKHFNSFRNIPISLLHEHTKKEEIGSLIELIRDKKRVGLIVDAGLPLIADPGALLVRAAHQTHIPITVYPGPSAIIMALMLSGLSAQSFTFHGYLPIPLIALKKKIKSLLLRKRETHLLIETPYRTERLLRLFIQELPPNWTLCIACNIGLPHQRVVVQMVKDWKKEKTIYFKKQRAVFVFGK